MERPASSPVRPPKPKGLAACGKPGVPPPDIKRGKHLRASAGAELSLAISAHAGQIVDRVVTNVNGHVVLQSDWEQEIAFEAFSQGRDPDSFTTDERKAALDRLIDQELLREQVRPSQPAPADQVGFSLPKFAANSKRSIPTPPPQRAGMPLCSVTA